MIKKKEPGCQEPKYLDIKQIGEYYAVKRLYMQTTETKNLIRRIEYNSIAESCILNCLRQTNRIEDQQKRKEFLNRELEQMLG